MYRIIPLAVFLTCLLGHFSVAQAASTDYDVQVHNSTSSTKKLYLESDLGGTQNISANTYKRYSTSDTAWYRKTKKHNHNFDVKDDQNQSYCTVTIWLKNKVTWYGKKKITALRQYSEGIRANC